MAKGLEMAKRGLFQQDEICELLQEETYGTYQVGMISWIVTW